MELEVEANVVVCIGQSAVLTGREVKALNRIVPYFPQNSSPIFVYVDDFGISDDFVQKTDYYYRYPKRYSTYFEGFDCGGSIIAYLLGIIECCDTCQSVSIIFSADEGLGSGLTAYLVQYISQNMPGLVILAIGLLPHMSQGGLANINTCLVMALCLEHAGCCVLRRMDESSHLLSTKKHGNVKLHASAFEDVYRCLAADILLVIREMQWPLSLCSSRCKLVDVRTSLWKDSVYFSNNSQGRSKSGAKGESTHHESLRLLGSNLHSLHLVSPLHDTSMMPTSFSNDNACDNIVNIRHASLLSVSSASTTSRIFRDIDFQDENACSTVVSILNGATPNNVRWRPNAFSGPFGGCISQLRMWPDPPVPLPTRHGTAMSSTPRFGGLSAHLSAVCFVSPYAMAILQEILSKASLTCQAGAYAYWLNFDNYQSCSESNEEEDRAPHVGAVNPTELVKIALHNLREYFLENSFLFPCH